MRRPADLSLRRYRPAIISLLAPCVLAVLGAPALAQAQDAVSVRDFLQHYAGTKRLSAQNRDQALADSVWLLKTAAGAADRYKRQLEDDARAGRPPRSCAKGASDTFSMDDLAADLATLPAARQDGPFDPAFFAFLDRRHPCKLALHGLRRRALS